VGFGDGHDFLEERDPFLDVWPFFFWHVSHGFSNPPGTFSPRMTGRVSTSVNWLLRPAFFREWSAELPPPQIALPFLAPPPPRGGVSPPSSARRPPLLCAAFFFPSGWLFLSRADFMGSVIQAPRFAFFVMFFLSPAFTCGPLRLVSIPRYRGSGTIFFDVWHCSPSPAFYDGPVSVSTLLIPEVPLFMAFGESLVLRFFPAVRRFLE